MGSLEEEEEEEGSMVCYGFGGRDATTQLTDDVISCPRVAASSSLH